VIRGEPGIGKSRLAGAIAQDARDAGAAVLSTAAYAAEQGIAYGPIVDALEQALRNPRQETRIRALGQATLAELARIVPALAPVARRTAEQADHAGVRIRLLASIADSLTAALAGPTPGVLIVDDIPWADRATIATLAYLIRRPAGRPFLMILTWRNEDLAGDSRVLADLALEHSPTGDLKLERLAREHVETLVQLADPAGSWSSEALWTASEGLPLYLASALAAGREHRDGYPPALPAGVRAVLSERLAAIDGVAAQVLAAAALIGRAFDEPTLRYASGRTEHELVDALDALGQRGLIRETARADGSPIFDFTHAAIRELSEESTSLARRRLIHRRIAEAIRLERSGAREDPGRLARIARHEREAGRDAEAAAAFREAGDSAARAYANDEAIQSYEAALGLGHPDAVELHVRIGELRTRTGEYRGAVRAYEAAAALAGAARLPSIEAALARTHLRAGDLVAAEGHLDAALAGPADPAELASWLVDRAVIRRRGGDRVGAERAAAEAEAAAELAGDARVAGAARRIAGLIALDAGETSLAVAHLEIAVAVAAEDTDPSASIAALAGLALALAAAGEVDTAMGRGLEAVALCRRIGDRHAEGAVENHLADLLHAAGRDDESLEHLRRSAEAFSQVGGQPDELVPGIWMLE
jgi:tetratricopeptide (TPR) repeat protein